MRAEPVVDWEIPPTPPGLAGRLERFLGPGKSRAESAVEIGGGLLCAALLVAGLWSPAASATRESWSAVQLTVVLVAGLDLIGGILTNATNAAKRWYHRRAPGARRARLLFVTAHLLHLAVLGTVVLEGDIGWTLGNAGLLLAGAAAVEYAPAGLARPVAVGVWTAVVLVNLFWLTVPLALVWFAPLFHLKLLVCHLVPEAPLRLTRARARGAHD
ncbi:hypothetical protein ABZX40_34865 [Streptomyces sp. NPDC004610]|uniref:hypothetical protein n=1 Tax=unclassified Streptomyces TaxID=2593676 RepID=UPI0033B5035F